MVWLREGLALKNRRGAFAIIFALFSIVLMVVSGMAVDMSRAATMKNELQTSADAAALAGAIQLRSGHDATKADYAARDFASATKNTVMGQTAVIDSVVLGRWDDVAKSFTAAATPNDAVRVVLHRQVNYFFAPIMGLSSPTMRAAAIGWAGAPVTDANCLKPWVLPYVVLRAKVNQKRGISPYNSAQNLSKPWDQDDTKALQEMTQAERLFNLKLGSQTTRNDSTNTISDPTLGATMPGNYYGVALGKLWDGATKQYANPGPSKGGSAYEDNVAGRNCHKVAVGDSLTTQPGNLVGPTMKGIEPNGNETGGVCESLTNQDDCVNKDGGYGVPIRAAFYLCDDGCSGRSSVSVQLLGSFVLTKVGQKNPNKAAITGYFEPVEATGPVGGGSTTLAKLILVR